MNIKRFVAPDMRQAIRLVRETLGPDAVILSNKSVDEGVELMAAVDLAHTDFSEARDTVTPSEGPSSPEQSATDTPDPLQAVRHEVQELRRLMESELGELNWREMGERHPQQRELLRRLMSLGLPAEIARPLSERVGDEPGIDHAWRKALFHLASELRISDDDILDQGGVVALVGPTGVGKTTTIAKLAARFALRHGHRHLALVTTDNFRIGARDQLETYGRILNVPVRTAGDPAALADVLDELSDRRLILIDTAGMGLRNERFKEQMEILRGAGRPIRSLLTLSATTEPSAMARALKLFAAARPGACVLTKLDEAASLGAAITAVIHSGLPLAFVADGQRVPEDLQVARAQPLVDRAAELMAEYEAECDPAYLSIAYGGSRAHARV